MPTCPNCKTELSGSMKFCPECGYDLFMKAGEVRRFCERCGRITLHISVDIPTPFRLPTSGRLDNPPSAIPLPIPDQVPIQTMRCKVCGQEVTDVGTPPPMTGSGGFDGLTREQFPHMPGTQQGPNEPPLR